MVLCYLEIRQTLGNTEKPGMCGAENRNPRKSLELVPNTEALSHTRGRTKNKDQGIQIPGR